MGCFAVFFGGKQVQVFGYQLLNDSDWKMACKNAYEFALMSELAGYHGYSIEDFGLSGVGVTAYRNGTMNPRYKNLLEWS